MAAVMPMSGRLWAQLGVFLWAACLLMGCAAEPPRPGPPLPRPPAVRPTPSEAALDQAIQEFYGAPYQFGGATPQGVDCSGLVQAAFQRVGVKLPRTVAQQFREGWSVPLGELRFGDVVFFNRFCQVRGAAKPFMASVLPPAYADEVCHNGIYVGQGRFVHASPKGVFVSRLDGDAWRASYMGARRYLP